VTLKEEIEKLKQRPGLFPSTLRLLEFHDKAVAALQEVAGDCRRENYRVGLAGIIAREVLAALDKEID
jgi:hypothetical protein